MTEINMRPLGLKLVFGAAVTLLLVSSVRQQWNTSQQKFARQVTSSNNQVSEQVREGIDDESSDGGGRLQTGDREERIDENLEDLEAKLTNENNDHGNAVLSEGQLTASLIEQDGIREDTVNRDVDQVPQFVRDGNETVDAEESVDNRQIASPVNFSTHTTFESQAKITQQNSEETYAEIPEYDSSNDRDPDWRSTKYADAVYADEEEDEDNNKNYKSHLDYNVISENEKIPEITYEDSDENIVQNENSKDSSVFSWFGLRNYFGGEDSLKEANSNGISENSQDINGHYTSQSNDTSNEVSGLDPQNTFITDKEENGTDMSRIRTYSEINISTNQATYVTNNTGSQQIETQQLQSNLSSKELPFGINGIDEASYDDFDDEGDQIQTKQTGNTNDPDYVYENSRSDNVEADPDLEKGFSNGRPLVPFAEEDSQVLRFGGDVPETSHIDSSTFQKSDEAEHGQQSFIQNVQQPPLLSNPTPSQSLLKSPGRPSILDLILADNLQLLQSQQFLTKLRYYLHQNIHRIDQDVDPNSVNKTTNTVFRQMQPLISPHNNPNNPFLSKMTAETEFDNSKIPHTEVNSPETNNDDIYDYHNDNTGTFYDAIHTNGDIDEADDNRDNQNGQASIYTSPPDPAVYDNPRPLSESEFALFRTQPYNTFVSLTKSVSESPVEVKFNEYHSGTSDTVLEQQQGTSDTGLGQQQGTSDAVLEQQQGTSDAVLEQQQGTSDTGLGQQGTSDTGLGQQGTSDTVLDQQQGTSDTGLGLQQGTSDTVLEQQQETIDTVLEQQQGAIDTVLEQQKGTSDTVLEQQQTNTEITKHEDESIPCPRQPHLAKTAQPITALVSFSDSSTTWVRTMLEQLTGIETDSIYNIMAQLKSGNAESVYNMGRTIAIETHMATDKNFDRAVLVIRNPFAVDAQHRIFRPASVEWQQIVLWNHTYATWLTSSLPLHVMTFEDLVESPLTELMKLANFLSTTDMTISYKCAMKVALDPPKVINDLKEITGIYNDDRKRINQNIDYVIQMALKKHSDIVLRLNSYKVLSGT